MELGLLWASYRTRIDADDYWCIAHNTLHLETALYLSTLLGAIHSIISHFRTCHRREVKVLDLVLSQLGPTLWRSVRPTRGCTYG
jgi:hypothetical protein